MKTLTLAAIRCSLMFTAVTASLFSVQPAQAYTVTLEQMGADVVANGSGAINLTGLTFFEINTVDPGVGGFFGIIETGPLQATVDRYVGLTGPTSFGHGAFTEANAGSGDLVGIRASDLTANEPALLVPQGYVSGAALSDSMTFENATVHNLGVRPGKYVWTWGDGANQSFTLIIVPDGGSTVSLLGCALLGLAALRRKLPLLGGRKS